MLRDCLETMVRDCLETMGTRNQGLIAVKATSSDFPSPRMGLCYNFYKLKATAPLKGSSFVPLL